MDNNDFEIEITEDKDKNQENVQLPLNFITVGEIEADDIRIYIKQSTYKALEEYSKKDTTKEVGTFLIGDYMEEMGKIHVIISDYIEAKYTDATASTLTFTHETWDYIYKEKEKLYPNKKIIGWQHTHPNYGIFLSSYDMFIQENFFNLEFQTAYVIDPIQSIRGFFQWKQGKVEKLKGFYIYDEVGKNIKIPQKTIRTEKSASEDRKTSKLLPALLALLLIALVGLSVAFITMNNKYKAAREKLNTAQQVIQEKDDTLETQDKLLEEVQEALIDKTISKENSSVLGSLIEKLQDEKIKFKSKDKLIESLKTLEKKAADASKETSVYFKTCQVKDGNTLSSLCRDNGVNYDELLGVIAAINGIDNPDLINPGQVIILPVIGEIK